LKNSHENSVILNIKKIHWC